MFPAQALLSTLLLALSLTAINASPLIVRDNLISLPLAKKVNSIGGSTNLVQIDQARANALRAQAHGKTHPGPGISVPVENKAVTYVANVGVGSPPTQYSLIIDTGSSNTWVGAQKPYTRTSTSSKTGDTVSVTYGSGSFSGTEFLDRVSLGPTLNIVKQSIGVADTSKGFDSVDGILGIGPVDLTQGTLSPDTSSTIPTVTDNLFTQGTISNHLVAISFEPTIVPDTMNGELTFGGTDRSKYTGSVNYVPITETSPASTFWGIDQSITYGSGTTILSETAGIVDTGTTLILIASDAFARYQQATGGKLDSNTGLLQITPAQYGNLRNLNFLVGGVSYELTPNAQIWPRSLNSQIGGTASGIYLIVSDLGSNSGQGLDFINGQTFLERFYSVYDSGNGSVGLATTPFTHAMTN
ncbi:hypothetical protein JAAARDRAFT_168376 [Jaapia argillacea MUCL 33604]|uniref:Peptidase A1 domain-containing protein n=1 Tax=Jaapia argillacea MUCL 33604 TaxID=933084 RepID=A0A067Q7R5_9AGAM|nr:hypothetical protein JAAARDRAFT_168376 [Jaapia argillacea MUCL 33604]